MEEEVPVLRLDNELGFGRWARGKGIQRRRTGKQSVFESSEWLCWAEVLFCVIIFY